MKILFQVLFLEDAAIFLDKIDAKSREKILYNIRKAQLRPDGELLKKLNDNIWEFRTNYANDHFRLLAFWDKSGGKETLVVATHGFLKKSNKTPKNEILKAEQLRKIYFSNK